LSAATQIQVLAAADRENGGLEHLFPLQSDATLRVACTTSGNWVKSCRSARGQIIGRALSAVVVAAYPRWEPIQADFGRQAALASVSVSHERS